MNGMYRRHIDVFIYIFEKEREIFIGTSYLSDI